MIRQGIEPMHAPLLSLLVALSIASSTSSGFTSNSFSAPCQREAVGQIERTLLVRVKLPPDVPEGPTTVTLSSEWSAPGILGLSTSVQSRSIEAGSDHVFLKDVPPDPCLLVACHQTPPKLVREAQRAAARAGEVPKTGGVWWAFTAGARADALEIELTLEPGREQNFLVRTAPEVPAEKVTVVYSLKSTSGLPARSMSPIPDPFQLSKRVQTKAGRFVLEGLLPGEWVCAVQVTDHGRTEEFTLTVPADGEHEVLVPRFLKLAGKIVGPEGEPVEAAWVGIEYAPTFLGGSLDTQVASSSDAQGAFTLMYARPGHGKLKASSDDGRLRAEQDIVIVAGEDQLELSLELKAAK